MAKHSQINLCSCGNAGQAIAKETTELFLNTGFFPDIRYDKNTIQKFQKWVLVAQTGFWVESAEQAEAWEIHAEIIRKISHLRFSGSQRAETMAFNRAAVSQVQNE